MESTAEQSSDDIEAILHTYGDMLFRLCLVSLGNASDAEDAVQETMLRYLQKAPVFQDAEHRKAWLLTVAANKCRDMLRHRSRHPAVDIDEIKEFTQESSDSGILDTLMTLPEKYRTVLVLYYVEGYGTEDIAKIVGKSSSAIKMRLKKGRVLLEEAYRRECM